MSTRIIASSSPNIDSAKARANSVLPTPVGPKKIKLPIGRLGSFKPALARLTALLIELTASFWPITLSCNVSSKLSKRCDSVSLILVNGIPVQPAITSAISSSNNDVFSPFWAFFQLFVASSYCFSNFVCLSRKLAAFSNSCACTAASFSFFTCSICCSISLRFGGVV